MPPRVLLGTHVLSDDTCRNSEDEGPIWNVLCDDRSRADDGAMTNLHVRQDERTHSDIGLILDATCAGDVGSRVYADAITERRVVTDKGAPIEEHVSADSRVSGHNHSSADDRALTYRRCPRDSGGRVHDRTERNAVGGSLFDIVSPKCRCQGHNGLMGLGQLPELVDPMNG